MTRFIFGKVFSKYFGCDQLFEFQLAMSSKPQEDLWIDRAWPLGKRPLEHFGCLPGSCGRGIDLKGPRG